MMNTNGAEEVKPVGRICFDYSGTGDERYIIRDETYIVRCSVNSS